MLWSYLHIITSQIDVRSGSVACNSKMLSFCIVDARELEVFITFSIVHIMGRKKLIIEEKIRVLTMLENGVPVIRLAANLPVSRHAIYDQNGWQQGFRLALHHLEKW